MNNSITRAGAFCWFGDSGNQIKTYGRLCQKKIINGQERYLSSDGNWYAACGALAKRMHQLDYDQAG